MSPADAHEALGHIFPTVCIYTVTDVVMPVGVHGHTAFSAEQAQAATSFTR